MSGWVPEERRISGAFLFVRKLPQSSILQEKKKRTGGVIYGTETIGKCNGACGAVWTPDRGRGAGPGKRGFGNGAPVRQPGRMGGRVRGLVFRRRGRGILRSH